MRKLKIFTILSNIILVATFLLLLTIFYWLFSPVKIIEYKNNPFPVIGSNFKAGQTIPFVVSYCRYSTIESHTVAAIVDGVIYTIGDKFTVGTEGCHKVISQTWKIPETISPGKYKLIFYTMFQINPLRTITAYSETQSFTVISN